MRVAGWTRYPDVAFRAVDLPEQAVTIPRGAAAVMDGEGCAAGEDPVDQRSRVRLSIQSTAERVRRWASPSGANLKIAPSSSSNALSGCVSV